MLFSRVGHVGIDGLFQPDPTILMTSSPCPSDPPNHTPPGRAQSHPAQESVPAELVFDLVGHSCTLATSDPSEAVVHLMTMAAKKSAAIVMRLSNHVELTAHDIWTMQEPNVVVGSSVIDAWAIFLGQKLPNSAKIAPSDLFARCHATVIKPLPCGGTKASKMRTAAMKGHLGKYLVGKIDFAPFALTLCRT